MPLGWYLENQSHENSEEQYFKCSNKSSYKCSYNDFLNVRKDLIINVCLYANDSHEF